MRLRSEREGRLLQFSVAATIAVSLIGVLSGMLASSQAILFDGFFSLLDAAITGLTLAVPRLVASQGSTRFQYGYWHLEPLVILLKSSVLIVLVGFAFLGAINSILKGGYEPGLGIALAYAVVLAAINFLMWWWMRRQAERIDPGLVRLDVKAWLMSALITTACCWHSGLPCCSETRKPSGLCPTSTRSYWPCCLWCCCRCRSVRRESR